MAEGGAVVRALASHQCGAGSILGHGVICGLSFGSRPCSEGFSPGTLVFLPQKNRQAAYLSWLLAVLQGHAWTVQWLPAAPIYAFGATFSSCVLADLRGRLARIIWYFVYDISPNFFTWFRVIKPKLHKETGELLRQRFATWED